MTRVPFYRRPGFAWLIGVTLVVALIGSTILVGIGAADRRRSDDPRSSTAGGAGALGQLLRDEGVAIEVTEDAAEAVDTARKGGGGVTLVVANPDLVDDEAARTLLAAGAARLVLLRSGTPALTTFGVSAAGTAPADGTRPPTCAAPGADAAGEVTFDDMRAGYRPTGPHDFACYPTGDGGYAYLAAPTSAGPVVQLVAGGIANADLDEPGNAAFATSVLGSQPTLVWLMGTAEPPADAGPDAPTLLPSWWPIAMVQAAIALALVGVWRGRRLGPILVERLPVKVRAAETVEGHGRLYYRLDARDRAGEALRSGARQRLGRAYGHGEDPLALSAAVAARTGRDPAEVRRLIAGPPPDNDDQLVALARDLDTLEQEARQI